MYYYIFAVVVVVVVSVAFAVAVAFAVIVVVVGVEYVISNGTKDGRIEHHQYEAGKFNVILLA